MVTKAYQTRRQKDSLIQVWLDRRYIATGAKWMQENNLNPRFLSDVFKFIFESAIDNLVNDKQVKFSESTLDAMEFLDLTFKNNLNPKNKGLKNLAINLRVDQEDGFEFRRTEDKLEVDKESVVREMKKHLSKFQSKEGGEDEKEKEGL